MPWKEPDCWRPVRQTCPAIENMKALVQKHVGNEDAREEMLALMEELRQENAQLRFNEKHWRNCAVW